MQLPIVIEKSGQRVLTTAQLAERYDTRVKEIAYNFSHNRKYYVEGKDFYFLTGEELKEFKNYTKNLGVDSDNHSGISGIVKKKTGKLYLWTERGALLHAKSIGTDKAWQVYNFLIDNYFKTKVQKEITREPEEIPTFEHAELLETSIITAGSSELEKLHHLHMLQATVAMAKMNVTGYLLNNPELLKYSDYAEVKQNLEN